MDSNENVSMARAIQQYGLKMSQLWLDGGNQSLINKYSSIMQDVYFLNQNVPQSANTKYYPGLASYVSAGKRYEPQYVGDSLAIQEWMSASLIAAGVRAAGNDVTQQRVVQLTNQITNFTADGMTTVVNWTLAHMTNTWPNCQAYTQVKGKQAAPVLASGHQVFFCFNPGVRNPTPVKAPAGTPGT